MNSMRFALLLLIVCAPGFGFSEGNFDYLDKLKNGGIYDEVGGRCAMHVEVLKDKGMVYCSWMNMNGFCTLKGTWNFICMPNENKCKARLLFPNEYVISVLPSGNILMEYQINRSAIFKLRSEDLD